MLGLLRPKIEPEAYFAYLHRLPDSVNVGWQRKEGYILGTVKISGFTFCVQGKDAREFVKLVNEGVLVAFDTPKEYLPLLLDNPRFVLPKEDWDRLLGSKKSSATTFIQDKKADELVEALEA